MVLVLPCPPASDSALKTNSLGVILQLISVSLALFSYTDYRCRNLCQSTFPPSSKNIFWNASASEERLKCFCQTNLTNGLFSFGANDLCGGVAAVKRQRVKIVNKLRCRKVLEKKFSSALYLENIYKYFRLGECIGSVHSKVKCVKNWC